MPVKKIQILPTRAPNAAPRARDSTCALGGHSGTLGKVVGLVLVLRQLLLLNCVSNTAGNPEATSDVQRSGVKLAGRRYAHVVTVKGARVVYITSLDADKGPKVSHHQGKLTRSAEGHRAPNPFVRHSQGLESFAIKTFFLPLLDPLCQPTATKGPQALPLPRHKLDTALFRSSVLHARLHSSLRDIWHPG